MYGHSYHQTRHCSCTCFQAKDIVPVSVSLCYRFQNSKLKFVADNQKFMSHMHQLPQHGVKPVCQHHDAEENGQPSAFCTPCWELLADLQSSIAGSNRLSKGRSNPTFRSMQERHISAAAFQAWISYLAKISLGMPTSDSSFAIHFPFLQMQTGTSAML